VLHVEDPLEAFGPFDSSGRNLVPVGIRCLRSIPPLSSTAKIPTGRAKGDEPTTTTTNGGRLPGVYQYEAVYWARGDELDALMQPADPPPSLLDLIRRPAWMAQAASRGTRPGALLPLPRRTD
jgi:hypothetical protein